MTSSEKDNAYWMQHIEGAGHYQSKDDLLHPEARNSEPDETLTESQYFGLCVPGANLHGSTNLYYHPNIGNVTGGVWAFSGFKHDCLASEMFDWRNHMSDAALKNDLHDYTLLNGYRVRVIEPGKRFRTFYEDKLRNNRLDLEYTAIMPPYMLASNNHFVQHMRAEGEVVLRGKTHRVNDYTVRNRSWGQARSEASQPLVPLTWMSGVFDAETSFYCSIFDDLKDHQEWQGKLLMHVASPFSNGFIRVKGELTTLVAGYKRVWRNADTLFPERIALRLIDGKGREYDMEGVITAGSAFSQWYNMTVALCQARWQFNGLTGHGDAQDLKWGDLIYLHHQQKQEEDSNG